MVNTLLVLLVILALLVPTLSFKTKDTNRRQPKAPHVDALKHRGSRAGILRH